MNTQFWVLIIGLICTPIGLVQLIRPDEFLAARKKFVIKSIDFAGAAYATKVGRILLRVNGAILVVIGLFALVAAFG